jgi:hypothetical protein
VPIACWTRARGAAHYTGAVMAYSGITEADVADLAQRCQDAAVALIRGDIRSYLDLFVHADDYTLIPPFGGAPRYGFDASEDAVEQMSRIFAGGEAQVDVVQSYVSGDFVVLVLIERQHRESTPRSPAVTPVSATASAATTSSAPTAAARWASSSA